jgi:hypothetical protein
MQTGLLTLFACLEGHDVRCVLVGGLAAVLHGVPRATFDVGLLLEATLANATRRIDALAEAGFETARQADPHRLLAAPIATFDDVLRVDVLLTVPGLAFHEARAHHEARPAGSAVVRLASLADLIRAKRASGRPRDLADIEELEQLA